ncbi:MAG TPA: hypothetical protein PLG10_00590 [Candidatus Dojkabacteria bacterium]|nr:hypothetical protein [Candidatus Dojkabacteria bacterium]
MEKSRKFKIFLSSLVVLFIFSFGVIYMVLKNSSEKSVLGVQNSQLEQEEEEKNVGDGIPYVVSQAPVSVYVGDIYEYVPRLVDIDTDVSDLSLELIDAPDWLYLDNGVVMGVAPEVVNTYSFVLKVSDGYNSFQQKSYILVQERDE